MPVQSTVPGLDGDAAGNLLRRAHEHRRLRQDAAEGVQLPAGRDQQPHVVRGHRRHRRSADSSGGCSSRSTAATSRSCRSATTSTPDSRLLMRRNIRERVEALAPFLTFDPDPYIVVGDDGRLCWMMDAFTTSDTLPVRAALPARAERGQLHPEQRQGRRRRLRRHDDVLRLRRRRSDHRRVSRRSSRRCSRTRRRCRRPAQARALSRAAARAAGGRLRPLSHDRSRGVLQPRGSLDGRERSRRATTASRRPQPMEPNFVLMTLPGETGVEFVEILPFTPANRNNLIGWIAGRSDGDALRHARRLQLSEEQARRRTAADRGAHRSEPAAVRPAVAVEPAGLARRARQPDRHSDRARAALRRADLSAGRTQPDAASCASSCSRCRIGSRTAPTFEAALAGLFGQRRRRRPRRRAATARRRRAARRTRQAPSRAGGSRRAHPRRRPRSRRLSAPDRRRQARRSGAAARSAQAEARTAAARARR